MNQKKIEQSKFFFKFKPFPSDKFYQYGDDTHLHLLIYFHSCLAQDPKQQKLLAVLIFRLRNFNIFLV